MFNIYESVDGRAQVEERIDPKPSSLLKHKVRVMLLYHNRAKEEL